MLSGGPLTLTFFDPVSERAASVLIMVWGLWIATVGTSVMTTLSLRLARSPPMPVREC
jgi:hypothetical protein